MYIYIYIYIYIYSHIYIYMIRINLFLLLVLTQDTIFRLRKLLSSIDLYYMDPVLQRNKFMQFIYMKIPPKVLCALNVQDA